jgi:hypothetical protein
MTKNQALTGGAIAFAAFAVWWTFKRNPTTAMPDRPAQVQRESQLGDFWSLLNSQSSTIFQSMPRSQNQISSLTGKPVFVLPTIGGGLSSSFVY